MAGKGSRLERGDCERLFQLLASQGALGERFQRNGLGFTNAYVISGPKARDVLSGKLKLSMAFSESGGAKKTAAKSKGRAPVAFEADDDYEEEREEPVWDPSAPRVRPAKVSDSDQMSDGEMVSACLFELRECRDNVSRIHVKFTFTSC